MIEQETKALQKVELHILTELEKLLRKNDIPFFLAYGSALGCVRHHGFIPWDDDVDIYILGSDYPKLQRVFAEQNTGSLALHDYTTVCGYPYVFPKIVDKRTKLKEKQCEHLDYCCGVYVDVFPLFEVPDNHFIRSVFEKWRYFRYGVIRAFYIDVSAMSSIKKGAIKLVKRIVNPQYIQNSLFKTYTTAKDIGEYYAVPIIFRSAQLVEKRYFSHHVENDFEGYKMPIPFLYDEYLSSVYGNYMQLPKAEDRHSNHMFSYIDIKDWTVANL